MNSLWLRIIVSGFVGAILGFMACPALADSGSHQLTRELMYITFGFITGIILYLVWDRLLQKNKLP
jgi:zinc transporter ZupT